MAICKKVAFRCDVNVSVRPKGTDKLGTRREIKNLNSFKFMQQAIEYETQWQIDTLEDGGKIQQATVLFNPDTGETKAMRSKEEANDYRYFPDPDLLPLEVTEADKARVQANMPELPQALQAKFMSEYQLSSYDANALTASKSLADYFVATVQAGAEAKPAANWILGALSAKLNTEDKTVLQSPVSAGSLAALLGRVRDNTISNNAAKQVFEALWAGEGEVDAIIEAKGLKQESDTGAIEAIIDEVLAANPSHGGRI
jgi:aspartyl-tRNA(Asn)/glutamyl-tRNA(Gln) amidotransferase subunit B